jgi:hypothetical protein
LTKEELKESGRLIMLYGPTGVGKTVSILQSATDPVMYILTEPRSLKPSLDAAARPELDIDVAVYNDFPGLMEFVAAPSNFERHQTVVVDSYSSLMSIRLSTEIEDQHFEARSEKERQLKSLTSQVKLSQEGYGSLSSWMFRLTAALGRLSQAGKVVIVTALLAENPRWNRELAAAPALKGREFPINMPGFFDLIGMCEPRVDAEGKMQYPPRVRFQSPDDSFVAKWTGVGSRTQGPLNISKILNLTERSNTS